MIRFPELETLGVHAAAFSEKADGDCTWMPSSGHAGPGRESVCAVCGVDPDALVLGRQVHGTRIAAVTTADRGRGSHDSTTAFPETDGLITNVPSIPLAILVADCVPIYLVDSIAGVIGLIHAGRQGTFDGIARVAVETMVRTFDVDPRDIHALIGPSAGPDLYEVSKELAAAWVEAGLPATGRLIDLWEANARQLAAAGTPAEQIYITGICTIRDDRFFSYRCGDATGRNMALLSR